MGSLCATISPQLRKTQRMKAADSVIIKFFVTVNIMFFMVPSFLSTETMINYMCVLIYAVSCRCFPHSEVAASVWGFF